MKRKTFFILLLPLLVIVGCKKSASPTRPPNEIHLNFAYSPLSIDPRKSTEPITCVMNLMLYEGLMHLEPDGTLSLAIANNIRVSKDRKSYLFVLRSSNWSDGTPLTAYDFESSWKKVLAPSYPSKSAHLLFFD